MDDSKSDTGSQELNTYAKQDNCASRAPEVYRNIRKIRRGGSILYNKVFIVYIYQRLK